jgi:hypothetical protein
MDAASRGGELGAMVDAPVAESGICAAAHRAIGLGL